MKSILLICLVCILSTFQQAKAQCSDTIRNTGHGCVGDTLKITVSNANYVIWKRGNTIVKTVNGTIPSSYGVTVAGQKDGKAGKDSIHLNVPIGMYVDKDLNIYVCEYGNNRVQKWSKGSSFGVTVAGQKDCSKGHDSAHFHNPTDVFVDSSGNVYVSDGNNNRVQEWKKGSKYGITVAGTDTTSGQDASHLNFPYSVFVDLSQAVYVADGTNNRVQKFSKGVKKATTVAGSKSGWAQYGLDSSWLYIPTGVFVDSKGNIYVSDAGNNRIQKWAPSAKYGITVAGQKGGSYGSDSLHLWAPHRLFVDSFGNIYIADAYNNRVQKYKPGAKYGITIAGQKNGASGSDSIHLNDPSAVYVDSKGNIYVCDEGNNRVQKFIQSIPNSTLSLVTDSAGLYTAVVIHNGGCQDTTNAINITSPSSSTKNAVVCSGKGYSFNGSSYSTTGTYYAHNKGKAGCDSTVTLNLTVEGVTNQNINDTIKSSKSVTINNKVYSKAGSFTDTVYYKSNTCDSVTLHITITVISSGINNIKNGSASISIYPNPNNGQFTLDLNSTNHSDNGLLQISNILGQVIKTQTVENTNGKLHTVFANNSLADGLYIVKVRVGDEVYISRLVVNR